MNRTRLVTVVAAVVAVAVLPGTALAVDPEDAVGGPGSEWFYGSLIQQEGSNCSIIGNSYTEVMVSAVGGYGGAPGGGAPSVGENYWATFLVSIPGNPCGSGSSAVATDLALPANTQLDISPSRPVRCFGQPRNASTFGEITGGTWTHLGYSGKYCDNSVGNSPHGNAVRFGFRPLANGTLYQIFVPVKSTATLNGGSQQFTWYTDATGVYNNPGVSQVGAFVFQSGGGGNPLVYFDRDPAAIPFWKAEATGSENRVEYFANLYAAGEAGNLCFSIRRQDNDQEIPGANCAGAGFNGSVPSGQEFLQVEPGDAESTGPNGGYVPFAYTGLENTPLKIVWTYTYNGGSAQTTATETFTTLSGPDTDGDGVANSADSCPSTKGTLPNGCLPAVQPDPDKDGVYGSDDQCPGADGKGTLNGCPRSTGGGGGGGGGGVVVAKLSGTISVKRNAKLKRKALAKGKRFKVTCSLDSKVAASLTVTKKVGRKLKLKGKLGSGRGTCTAAKGGSFKLKLTKKAAKRLRRKRIKATLTITFTRAGAPSTKVVRPVRIS